MTTMKNKNVKRGLIALIALGLIVILMVMGIILSRYLIETEEEKYGGHGFDYMNGFSSTDFTGYHVFDGEKLYSLDHPASLLIENVEDMPVLDGAEACYPVYAAVAKAIYKDISEIELQAKNSYKEGKYPEADWHYNNGRIVSFTNTVYAYGRLVNREVDLVFGARPSQDQREDARFYNEQIISTPIGKEAFVFFVEEDNPVEGLTSDQVKAIYHGDITNWKEVGGLDQEIIAFQRPENSGSQATMKYFMGDISLKDPDVMEKVDAMAGVIEEVKQYHNEAGALGYTFQYFLTGLQQEEGVKMLAIDGVYPSVEHIKDGSYPILVNLVCAKRASNKNPYVDKVIEFLLSDDGQEIIEKTGYGPLADRNVEPIVENEIDEWTTYNLESEDHTGEIRLTVDGYSDVIEMTYDGKFIKGDYFMDEENPGTYIGYATTPESWVYGPIEYRFTFDADKLTILDSYREGNATDGYGEIFPNPGDVFVKKSE